MLVLFMQLKCAIFATFRCWNGPRIDFPAQRHWVWCSNSMPLIGYLNAFAAEKWTVFVHLHSFWCFLKVSLFCKELSVNDMYFWRICGHVMDSCKIFEYSEGDCQDIFSENRQCRVTKIHAPLIVVIYLIFCVCFWNYLNKSFHISNILCIFTAWILMEWDLCKTLPHSLSFLFLSTIGSPAVYIFDF